MTTIDPLASPDAIALLAALDDGDDSVLPILADLLEEVGDNRAAGLRAARVWGEPDELLPSSAPEGWCCWWVASGIRRNDPHAIPLREWSRLRGDVEERRNDDQRVYPSRSAAFLALVQALSQ